MGGAQHSGAGLRGGCQVQAPVAVAPFAALRGNGRGMKVVGLAGFEPATYWSQTSRATKLRYSPTCRTLAEGA